MIRSAPRLAVKFTRSLLGPKQSISTRNFSSTRITMGKVVMVLYKGGKWAEREPRLYGTTENALGLRDWIKEQGHELVVTDDKDGPNSELSQHAKDAEVIITTPFHPGYITRELISSAKNLKLCATAGVGSDHIDLDAANEKSITVCEVTGSNVVSVAEHVVMTILILVRNYDVGHHIATVDKRWDIARVASNAFDLENKVVGTLGAGRIGFRVLQRLKPFDCKELLYYDYTPLPEHAAKEVGARRVEKLEDFLSQVDVLTINAPLHEGTKGLINKETLKHLKKGAWIVNTARGAICNEQDVADAVKSGQIRGYGGDVWYPQPAPADHPWRTMHHPNDEAMGNSMVPHYSGTVIDAQTRYAEGVKRILDNFWNNKPQRDIDVIVQNGDYATKAYGQRDAKPSAGKGVGASS